MLVVESVFIFIFIFLCRGVRRSGETETTRLRVGRGPAASMIGWMDRG